MTREDKTRLIDTLAEKVQNSNHFYITDISGLDALKTSELRRMCHKQDVELMMVKNTLFRNALEKIDGEYEEVYPTLKGNTAIMFSEIGNAPARLIKDFHKKNPKAKQVRPLLKGAFVEESAYIGENELEALANIKSKEELIADVVLLLQSPVKTLVSQLQSGSNSITGVLKTLADKQ